jgi:hypothetical protein
MPERNAAGPALVRRATDPEIDLSFASRIISANRTVRRRRQRFGALQFGADVETIRNALCRDGRGNASGPLGIALDMLASAQRRRPG